MKSIFDVKRNMEALKKSLLREIKIIDRILEDTSEIDKKRLCPRCNGRDVRILKDDNMFCKSCGFDSRPNSYASFLEDTE